MHPPQVKKGIVYCDGSYRTTFSVVRCQDGTEEIMQSFEIPFKPAPVINSM